MIHAPSSVILPQIPAKHLSSDLSFPEEREVYDSLTLREPVTKLLYVTPEKVCILCLVLEKRFASVCL